MDEHEVGLERLLTHLREQVERAWIEYQDGEHREYIATMRHIALLAKTLARDGKKKGV